MIAATEPTGKKMEALRTMLSESATFQASVVPSDSAEVLTHVHSTLYRVVGEETVDFDFPFVVIERDLLGAAKIAQGTGQNLIFHGTLVLHLARDDKHPGNAADGEQDFANWAIGVLVDLLSVAGQDANLNITRLEQLEPIAFGRLETEARHWHCSFRMTWGVAP